MKIQSFTVDHDKLLPGVYVSRKDNVGNHVVTTFDIRMKIPNKEPVLDNPAIHTLEHLIATYLRTQENPFIDKIIYFGPMGCRTGMYLIVTGDYDSIDVLELVKSMYKFVIDFQGDLPGNTSIECGNYLDHNITTAKWEAAKYMGVLNTAKEMNLVYPN
ncbi:MAG: S-ribosylhomocysteine lyase [Lachnospirales bacterium]